MALSRIMQNLARSLALAAPRKRMRPGSGFPRFYVDDRAAIPAIPRPTAQAQPTPVPGNPKALRDDIQIRKILETGGGFVRLKRDPSTNTIYYMNNQANIFRLDVQPGNGARPVRAYTRADIGVDSGFVAAGLAFAPDGTLYVLGNISAANTTQAV